MPQIVNIIMFVVILAVASIISPIIGSFMDAAIIAQNATGISLILMQSIVPMFWLGIILLFFMMITGQVLAPPQEPM